MVADVRLHGFGVLWLDNFNKQAFARNPNEERNRCINGAAIAVLATEVVHLATWNDYPELRVLHSAIGPTITLLQRLRGTLTNGIRRLLSMQQNWSQVRVPCDLRRHGVTLMPWRPVTVLGDNVWSTAGLLRSLQHALHLCDQLTVPAARFGGCQSVLPCMYSESHLDQNVGEVLRSLPMLFGIWHTYVHCLKQVYATFRSLLVALEYPEAMDLDDAPPRIYNFPQVFTLEGMVTGLFLAQ